VLDRREHFTLLQLRRGAASGHTADHPDRVLSGAFDALPGWQEDPADPLHTHGLTLLYTFASQGNFSLSRTFRSEA
jgi:hypothetical protein